MLYCCGQNFKYNRIITPLDSDKYTNRSLEIGRCPKCGALICELIQYSKLHNRFITVRPKKKDVLSFIKRLESEPYKEETKKVKYGTRPNMNTYYFVAHEVKDKGNVTKLRHYKYDFNDTVRAIYEVDVDYNNKVFYTKNLKVLK